MKRYPAEFEEQSFIQIIFPHENSDWSEYLDEAEQNFITIINTITRYQDCLVVCHDMDYVNSKLKQNKHLHLVHASTNDTWARDCSALSLYDNEKVQLLDFTFTAWGGKFEADLDNQLSATLKKYYSAPMQNIDFILEGGGIESNGKGTLLLTSECVFNKNRNALSIDEAKKALKGYFNASHIIALEHGYLRGDDTDSHIDTLARFIDETTIVYLECEDENDEHFQALQAMKRQLQAAKDQDGNPFTLVALPFTKPIYDEDERLPATYANFLILNEVVLVPVYNDVNDQKACDILASVFKTRRIIPIDCSTLIRQHGSLHCVTMQFPKGVNLTIS